MSYNRVVISSGHGLYVRGASGPAPWGLDEVNEARRVVDRVAEDLRHRGIDVVTFHDNVSKTQSENLDRIVDFHNSCARDLDLSCHFNAYQVTSKAMGCEVLYLTQAALASQMSRALALATGLPDRGGKKRTDLAFLNNTSAPAVLAEICFVDSETDAFAYQTHFDLVCEAICSTLAGDEDMIEPELPDDAPLVSLHGKVSCFGGPHDDGVDPDEGLAFLYDVEDAPHLFLPTQPEGTTGLARRLNPYIHYLACRWDYDVTPKDMLRDQSLMARVTAIRTGISMLCFVADWGPHDMTDRVADISPGLMTDLGITTDDEVIVIYPAPLEEA
jgi:N-acetylmuramoyl-L-alanine amidase